MTKLIATPLDLDAPGSHGDRLRVLEAYADYEEARETGETRASLRLYRTLEAMLLPHLETDDDTKPADALLNVSANAFDDLVSVLLRTGEKGDKTVPPGSETS